MNELCLFVQDILAPRFELMQSDTGDLKHIDLMSDMNQLGLALAIILEVKVEALCNNKEREIALS